MEPQDEETGIATTVPAIQSSLSMHLLPGHKLPTLYSVYGRNPGDSPVWEASKAGSHVRGNRTGTTYSVLPIPCVNGGFQKQSVVTESKAMLQGDSCCSSPSRNIRSVANLPT